MSRDRRGNGIQEVVGSIPISSTNFVPVGSADPTMEWSLKLPPAHDKRRGEIGAAVASALRIARDFAAEHGWSSLAIEPFFSSVEIFETEEALWRRLVAIYRLEESEKPTDALTAAVEDDILLAVVPEEATRNRPEYFRTPDDWSRALAHEIIHRLHVRILEGNEDAMGPHWFYEAFAVLGSGQPLGMEIGVAGAQEALELTRTSGRGAYARYAAALRFFAQRIPLQRLIDRAAAPEFEAWLRSESEKSNV